MSGAVAVAVALGKFGVNICEVHLPYNQHVLNKSIHLLLLTAQRVEPSEQNQQRSGINMEVLRRVKVQTSLNAATDIIIKQHH